MAEAALLKEVEGLNLRSTPGSLEAGRRRLAEIRKDLETQGDGARIARVEAEIERLDAALAYRAVHERWDAALREANHGESVTDSQLPSLRTSFRAKDRRFQELDDALLAAERRYVQAANRLRGLTPP